MNFNEALLLHRMTRAVQTGCIVEIGSYLGRSKVSLGCRSLNGNQTRICAVDRDDDCFGMIGLFFGSRDRTAFYRPMLATGCSEIISLINRSSEMSSSIWNNTLSLLRIDGDRCYMWVRRHFDCWLSSLSVDALIAFDDANDHKLLPLKLIDQLTTYGDVTVVTIVSKI